MKPAVVSLGAVLLLLACGRPDADMKQEPPRWAQPGATTATPAVLDFDAPKLGGGRVAGSDFAGKDVALWFWAPW